MKQCAGILSWAWCSRRRVCRCRPRRCRGKDLQDNSEGLTCERYHSRHEHTIGHHLSPRPSSSAASGGLAEVLVVSGYPPAWIMLGEHGTAACSRTSGSHLAGHVRLPSRRSSGSALAGPEGGRSSWSGRRPSVGPMAGHIRSPGRAPHRCDSRGPRAGPRPSSSTASCAACKRMRFPDMSNPAET